MPNPPAGALTRPRARAREEEVSAGGRAPPGRGPGPRRRAAPAQSALAASSVQMKLDRQDHPRGDRLRATSRRLETPLADGLGRGPIKVWVSGRSVEADLSDTPVREHLDPETRCALNPRSSCRGRIGR